MSNLVSSEKSKILNIYLFEILPSPYKAERIKSYLFSLFKMLYDKMNLYQAMIFIIL